MINQFLQNFFILFLTTSIFWFLNTATSTKWNKEIFLIQKLKGKIINENDLN